MKSNFYRVWDNLNNKYFEPTYEALNGKLEDLHLGLAGSLFMRTMEGTIHCDSIFPYRFELEMATHKLDKNQVPIFAGDLLLVDELRIVVVVWHEFGAAFDTQFIEHLDPGLEFRTLKNSSWDIRTRVVGHVHDYSPNRFIYLKTENQAFPVGSELTSKENGELIIAPEGTPQEEIVGVVTLNGLETK